MSYFFSLNSTFLLTSLFWIPQNLYILDSCLVFCGTFTTRWFWFEIHDVGFPCCMVEFSGSSFSFISPLLPSPSLPSASYTFVKSQSHCHSFFQQFKVPLHSQPVPPLSDDFWTIFSLNSATSGTQRSIMTSIYKTQYTALLSDSKSPSPDFARVVSVSQPSSGRWLTTLPFHPSLSISNSQFSISSRIRLGLPPVDNLVSCSCTASLTNNPLHFLECRLLRSLITARHHRIISTFARISRLIGISVVLEPRIGMDDM